ncbi:MAG: 30S ribosomal protein S5 [Chloroflexi bacterium]|nr:30S ribosomal protein S5 [Chloroflexota bacterium]
MVAKHEASEEVREFSEKVVKIRRVAKVVKGGRHLSFNALVVVGDGHGNVGVGLGKADSVPDAIRKGTNIARKNVVAVLLRGRTIPHRAQAKYGAAIVLIKPASLGTGIIAGGVSRAVLELAGVKDVVCKSLKSGNPINVAGATFQALRGLRVVEQEQALRKGEAPKEKPPAPA